tara:strand:+ start:329 stop:553 length:225 start_codon:yes stop_codon:yes gene_type:complete
MAIKPIDELQKDTIEVDLTGPNGNAFYLLGLASKLAKEEGIPKEQVLDEMRESDYENLIKVFDSYFSHLVTLYR